MSWQFFDNPPKPGTRFVALFADCSGAEIFYLSDKGALVDSCGAEILRGADGALADWLLEAGFVAWVALPDGLRLFFEEAGV